MRNRYETRNTYTTVREMAAAVRDSLRRDYGWTEREIERAMDDDFVRSQITGHTDRRTTAYRVTQIVSEGAPYRRR